MSVEPQSEVAGTRRTTRSSATDATGAEQRSFECRGAASALVRCDLDCPPAELAEWRGFVTLFHGFKGFARWGFFPDLGQRLAAAGFAVLRVDLSHNGTGRGQERAEFTRLDLFESDRISYRLADASAALAAAVHEEPRLRKLPRAFIGHSLGGGLALLLAKRTQLEALVTLASVPTLGFTKEAEAIMNLNGHLNVPNARTGQMMRVGASALRDYKANESLYDLSAAARSLGCPWLIVHGGQDTTVPVQAAKTLSEAAPEARVLVLDEADHTFGCRHPFEQASESYEQMTAALLDFLQRRLPRPAESLASERVSGADRDTQCPST